jgi:hypothetical protein
MREVAYTHRSFLRTFTLVKFLSVNYDSDWTDLLIKDFKFKCYFTIKKKMMVINGDFVRFNGKGELEDILSKEYAKEKYNVE